MPDSCTKAIRVHGGFPKGRFKPLVNESYRRSPIVKYEIEEDGTVTNAALGRSSGVADIDKKVVDAIANWKYKPDQRVVGRLKRA